MSARNFSNFAIWGNADRHLCRRQVLVLITGQGDHLHPCAGGAATIGVFATGGTDVEHHEGALTRGRPPGPPAGELVSGFSKVDQSAEPARLVAYLDEAAVWLCGLKHYVAAAHALRRPTKPVLDLGCGTGHDLALLESFGLRAIGVDPSETMLAAASRAVTGAGAVAWCRRWGGVAL